MKYKSIKNLINFIGENWCLLVAKKQRDIIKFINKIKFYELYNELKLKLLGGSYV